VSAALAPLAPDARARFDWIASAPVQKILAALTANDPGAARFVGGCVRDSLIGVRPKDIDIATTLTPEAVMAALRAAGLAAAPTGLDHGTLTAIADHFPIEVTSLRADVSTDGRRAAVAFTTDWETDARRRDFTLNALYLTPDLRLFDPVGGLADLSARRVRFIGPPEDRIREDFLRILRFFRFSARFAADFDGPGLAACAALKAGLGRLSAERIGDELTKILAHPAAARAARAMSETGVLGEVWPAPADLETFRRLKIVAPEAGAPLGLAALWGAGGEGIDARLRLSNADGQRRRRAVERAPLVAADLSDQAIRALIYRFGSAGFRDALTLAKARAPDPAAYVRHDALAASFFPPQPPFSGHDVLAAGIGEGPEVAAVLAAAEARWIAEDFPPPARGKAILAEEIARLNATG
jgi:poly(A) polymerase